MKHVHRVYAIKYGHLERKARTNFINPPGDHDADMPMDYFLWLVRCESGRTIVIDTGYNACVARQRGRTMLRHPADGLAQMGVNPQLVEDVVITHLHYDHAGNVEAFPKARFWLQESEMQFTTGKYMCRDFFRLAYEREDVVAMVDALFDNRLHFVDGDAEIEPGVTLHHVGGHTAGLQVVRVQTEAGPVVVASDLFHYYANFDHAQPFPIVYSPTQLLDSFERAKALVKDGGWLVPGHDPLVMSRFRAEPEDPEFTVRLWEPAL
ncbi:N-acyl homoserine lactonase family protein [Variovorax sp. RA8]|uniref:N-acyl homoserine lactonase family protein n=1 Tax=Variovorax sp. (strain JCM 16519 / RA8) TaxID=662548 RepID=UPI000A84A750|nr:N-acyl homoserine lactonase family protein [Variovorax sp. RA8]VTU41596.1 N-acyl homoserine lactonase [Variovorax sp. RA8]